MADSANGVLDRYFQQYEDDPDFIAEGMAIVVVEDALRLMQSNGLSRSDMANALGVSRSQVSRLFNAPPNLTLRSIARLAVALGVKPYVCLDLDVHKRVIRQQRIYHETAAGDQFHLDLEPSEAVDFGGANDVNLVNSTTHAVPMVENLPPRALILTAS